MKNRVYGVAAIKSIMSNWNADFTGMPKTTSTGAIFGSDKAFKYPMKKMWENEGEKVLYLKSYIIQSEEKKEEKSKLQPRNLKERYEKIFAPDILENAKSDDVLKNLFSAVDVMNFGATFAEAKQNISITGAVQIGQGYNKYQDTIVETQDILSPFRNSKKDEADASSLGTKIMVDEAHYFYPFSIIPDNYNEYIGIVDAFAGYTKEAYHKFKRACCLGATAIGTNSKAGCENEFALFIECKDESKIYMPNLDSYIDFEKKNGKNRIKMNRLCTLIKDFTNAIAKIEIYINPLEIEVEESLETLGCEFEMKNIFTLENLNK